MRFRRPRQSDDANRTHAQCRSEKCRGSPLDQQYVLLELAALYELDDRQGVWKIFNGSDRCLARVETIIPFSQDLHVCLLPSKSCRSEAGAAPTEDGSAVLFLIRASVASNSACGTGTDAL